MSIRAEMADKLAICKEAILSSLGPYPLEIEFSRPSGYIRVVIDTPAELDMLFRQLTAERVSPEEALNLTLVWPRG